LLRYDNFTLRLSESEFLRYPQQTVKEAIEAATPHLAQIRQKLLQARDDLILGYGRTPMEDVSYGRGADLVLIEAGRQICPRSPSTLHACIPDLATR
ncbi:MAG: hypothetical protein SGPRY_011929, partial [Prymnesium sp.]